jgi:hypothetical protein
LANREATAMTNFLDRPTVKVIELTLAILSVPALLVAIYHVWAAEFAARKAISVAYRTSILAESGVDFGIEAFVRPELAQSKKVVALDLIFWNSGRDAIRRDDIRGASHKLTIRLDNSILIAGPQRGKERTSAEPGNFELVSETNNTLSLTWKDDIDRDNYFESHLLLATDLERNQLDKIVKIDGSIAGAPVDSFPFHTRRELRATLIFGIFFLATLVIIPVGVFGVRKVLSRWQNLSSAIELVTTMLISIVFVSASFALIFVIAVPVAGYLTYVPEWTEIGPTAYLRQIFLVRPGSG